jgi:hypothetical protein
VVLLEENCCSLIFRQATHDGGDMPTKFCLGNLIFNGRRRGGLLRSQFGRVDAFRYRHKWRSAFAPDGVPAQIQGNPVDPGRKLRLAFERVQAPIRTEKRLLTNVARILVPAKRPVREGVNRPFPAQDQLIKTL